MFIRTKRKGTEYHSDLHHFTNKWTEIPDGEVRVTYTAESNLEVREDRPPRPTKAKKPEAATAVTGEPALDTDT